MAEIEVCASEEIHEELLSAARGKMPSDEKIYALSELFKAFGDETRMKILFALFKSEFCVCDLAALLGMTPSAVSHQLKMLKTARLIKSRRDGKSVFYSLSDDHVRTVIQMGLEHSEE